MDDFGDDQITTDDIDMLNSNDLLLGGGGGGMSIGKVNHMDSPLDSSTDAKSDSLEDSFLVDTETKTPGEILDEFCMKLEDINTTMPDSVINHYMKKAGFIVNDPKLVKIISIASQKFISEIVNDVMQHHKLKTKSAANAASNQASAGSGTAGSSSAAAGTSAATAGATTSSGATKAANATDKSKSSIANGDKSQAPLTLTLEDLSQVLSEYGINVKKPYYFM